MTEGLTYDAILEATPATAEAPTPTPAAPATTEPPAPAVTGAEEWPNKAVNAVSNLRRKRDHAQRQLTEMRTKYDESKAQLDEKRGKEISSDDYESYMEYMEAKQKRGLEIFRDEQNLENQQGAITSIESEVTQSRNQEYDINIISEFQSNAEFRQLMQQNEALVGWITPEAKSLLMQLPDPAAAIYAMLKGGTFEHFLRSGKEFAVPLLAQAQIQGHQMLRMKNTPPSVRTPTVSQTPPPRVVPEGAGKGAPAGKPINTMSGDELYKEFGIAQ